MRRLMLRSFVLIGVAIFNATPGRADAHTDAAEAVSRGLAAFRAQDHPAFLAEFALAHSLRSDHPTYLYYLAAAQGLAGDAEASARSLHKLASWGIYVAAEKQPEFEAVRDAEAVQSAFVALRQNQTARGEAKVHVSLPANGGLYEGVAEDPRRHHFYVSDLHHGRILRVDHTGTSRVFATLPREGFGCGGLAVDTTRNLLWVASPALPEVAGFEEAMTGRSQLIALDLDDGTVVRRLLLPTGNDAAHTVVDLMVGPDGAVFAPDSASPVIWHVAPGSDEATVFATIESPGTRHSLQGAALSPDGQWLLVSDYSTGLHRVRLEDRRIEFLSTPAEHIGTAIGIDGIAVRGRSLLAVQNGVTPARLLRISLTPDGRPLEAQVAASGWMQLADPTLVTVTADGFLVIGTAGWPYFGDHAKPDPADRLVHVVRVPPTD